MKLFTSALYDGIIAGAINADIKDVCILIFYDDGTVYSTPAYPLDFLALFEFMQHKLENASLESVKSACVVIYDCDVKCGTFMNTLISF